MEQTTNISYHLRLACTLNIGGGAAAGYFLWFYRQGHYHLYKGFGGNEYFEPTGGLQLLHASALPWILMGAMAGLAALALLSWICRTIKKNSWEEALSTWRWLGLPGISLLVHPVLSLVGVSTTLVPLFHFVVATGLVVAMVVWGIGGAPVSSSRKDRACFALLFLLMVLHSALLAGLNLRQYYGMNLGFSDSGSVAEGMHQTLRGRFMISNNHGYHEPGPGSTLDHLFWTRVALVPVFWLYPFHETLIVVQALLLSFGALPVYLMAKHLLRSHLAGLLFAISYFAYPPLLYLNFRSSYGPEESGHGVPFLLFVLYYLLRTKPRKAIIFAALAICAKETYAIMIAMVGVWLAFSTRHRREGIALAAGSMLYFIIGRKLIIPLFAPTGFDHIVGYFRETGGSYSEIAWKFISNPLLILERVAEYRNLSMLLHMLAPLAMLPLVRPSALAIMIPSMLVLFISNNPMHHTILFWNHATLIPICFFSAVLGASRLNSFITGRSTFVTSATIGLSAAVAVCSVLSACLFFVRMITPETFSISPRAKLVKDLRAFVPRESSVLVTYRLASHFVDYRDLYLAQRYLPKDQDYLIFDPLDRFLQQDNALKARDAALKDPTYGLVYNRENYLVFKKGAPKRDPSEGILHTGRPEMDVNVDQEQHGFARLMGWNNPRLAGNGKLVIESFWECLSPTNTEYDVLVQFQNPDGTATPTRHLMAKWLYPTTIWKSGDMVRTESTIDFAGQIPETLRFGIKLIDWRKRIE